MNFRVLLNCALIPTQLISASTKFFASPLILLEPKYHMKLGNFPKFRWKIQICLFYLKINKHGILEVLIPNPHIDFWNFDPKIHFWANLVRKGKNNYVYDFIFLYLLTLLQFGALCTLRLIYVLWTCNIIDKSQLFALPENWQSISSILF